MTSDGALLALIVDDGYAMRLLAAWGALAPRLSDIDDPITLAALAELAPGNVAKTLIRLRAARAIVDGGISDLADKALQARVSISLGQKKKK
jgi:hypothetical protein